MQDDARQAPLATDLLRRCHEAGTRCFVSTIVLCELEWVLTSAYEATRSEIASAVAGLLSEELFEVEQAPLVRQALDRYRRGPGDLSDHLLGATAGAAGVETTYTLDRTLRDSELFTLLN